MRETLRDYVVTELAETAATGLPLNRPLFFDAPADAATWDITDQFYFGRDYMVRLYPAASNGFCSRCCILLPMACGGHRTVPEYLLSTNWHLVLTL